MHAPLVSVLETKKVITLKMSLMILIEGTLQNHLKDMHAFQSISVGEDTTQYYVSLLLFFAPLVLLP